MSTKKRYIQLEASGIWRLLHDEWTSKYGVIKHNDKALCYICKEIIIAFSYNIYCHFVSNHDKLCLMTEEKCENIYRRVKKHKCQSNYFKGMLKPRNNIFADSFQLSHTIALFSDGDYLKETFKYCF